MTVTEHYAHAVSDALPGVQLGVEGGQVGLDVARWPHVQATIKTPARAGLYAAMDPRAAAHRVVLSCGEQVMGLHRQFDLGIRHVGIGADGLLEMQLASDEAIVEDETPDADVRPWAYLRANGYVAEVLTEMVLARSGFNLTDPGPVADITPYWSLTNRVVNPRFQTTIKGAAAGSGTSGLVSTTHTAAGSTARRALQFTCGTAGGSAIVAGWDPAAGHESALPVSAGDWVSASFDASCVAPNRDRRIRVQFFDGAFTLIYEVIPGGQPTAPDTRWTTHAALVQAPIGAVYCAVRAFLGPIASGADQRVFVTNVSVVQWDDYVPAFNGGDTPPGGYTVSWDGAPDDSTSTRYPIVPLDPESLVQKAGQGGMSFLAPVLQACGLRLVCDETRAWSLRGIDHVEPGELTIAYGETMTDFALGAGLDGWCDAATVHYEWERYGVTYEMDDTFELVTPPRKRIRRTLNMPYPGPGRAENIVRRAQAVGGRSSTARAVSNWSVKSEQTLTVTTDDTTLTGQVGAVTFDLDTDEMTVTIREEPPA